MVSNLVRTSRAASGDVMMKLLRLTSWVALGALGLGCSGAEETPPPHSHTHTVDPCAGVPDFSLFMVATGEQGAIKGVLVSASPAPPERYENDWTVEFRDASDEPLGDVELTMAEPFMPAHNHDGTFAPVVAPLEAPGRFEIQDLNLWMPGLWEIRFTVESASAGSDYVVFEACIPE